MAINSPNENLLKLRIYLIYLILMVMVLSHRKDSHRSHCLYKQPVSHECLYRTGCSTAAVRRLRIDERLLGIFEKTEFRIVMASLGHQITVEQTDELIHEFDVDESDGIEIFEFISMIQKFQQDFQLDPVDELIEALQ